MKIVFIGTVDMSHALLEKLIQLKADISGVVTQKFPNLNSDYKDLVPLCKLHSIPWVYADQMSENEMLKWITLKKPDMIFCFGWSFLLKDEVLDIPPKGVLGFHPALLPENRGRHPLIWTLVLGCDYAGSTFFYIDQGTDSGDIISQKKIKVSYEDTAATLYEKIKAAALNQVELFSPQLENNCVKRVVQDDTKATYWRKRSRLDGKIDFRMSSRAVYNLVRALSHPYPGAHIKVNDSLVKIWTVEEISDGNSGIEPGKVLQAGNHGIDVKCYTDAIRIIDHEFKRLPLAGDYL